MTEIKISDEMVEELAAEIGRCFVDLVQVRPLAGAAGNPMADSMARRLVASGWRREADVLREAAERMRSSCRHLDGRVFCMSRADDLGRWAAEAEQYVSAGPEPEDNQSAT
jgi:hypothetical protein